MILTCDNCSTSFNVPESAIGEHGRFVRCSKCGYEWVATLPEKPLELEQEVEEIKAQLTPDEINSDEVKNSEQAFKEKDNLNESLDFLRSRKVNTQETSEMVRRKSVYSYILIFATIISVLFLVLVCLLVYKDKIIAKVPLAEKIYNSLEIYSYSSLIFEDIICECETTNKANKQESINQTVNLSLKIKNIGDVPQYLGYVKVTAFDKNMRKLSDLKVRQNKLLNSNDKHEINGSFDNIATNAHFLAFEICNLFDLFLYNPKQVRSLVVIKNK